MSVSLRSDHGFTLVEVLVAMTLVLLLVQGAAEVLLVSVRLAEGAREQTFTVLLASAKVEDLRSDLPAIGGSLDRDEPGFVDYLDTDGTIVGMDTEPRTAVYVRRWAVAPLTPSLPGVSALRVRVLPAVHADHSEAPGPRPRLSGETELTAIVEGAS